MDAIYELYTLDKKLLGHCVANSFKEAKANFGRRHQGAYIMVNLTNLRHHHIILGGLDHDRNSKD